MQCSNTKVGAGTMNPLTYLRVLGPEPWNVAYVEPSIRPDDSHYGENPKRLQRHTQFQVIPKLDLGNSQDLFIRSLSELGIDVSEHDIRFVEDNWESPHYFAVVDLTHAYRYLVHGVWAAKSGWMGWRSHNSPTSSRYINLLQRLEQYLVDKGISAEVVCSALAERENLPCLAAKTTCKMKALSKDNLFPKVVEAYYCPTRIVRGKDVDADMEVDDAAFETNEESFMGHFLVC